MGELRVCLGMLRLSIRSQLRYKSALALQALGQFTITAIEFAGIYLLFERFGTFRGWDLAELAFIYGYVDLAFSCADGLAYGFDSMGSLVKSGDFDRLLARPVSPFVQLIGRELTLRRAGRFFQGLAVFIGGAAALARGGPAWYAPAKLLVLAAGWLAGFAVFFCVFMAQGALSFWTTESTEAMNAFSYGGRQAAAYPMSGYRAWLRTLFVALVPVGGAMYLPACFALGRPAFPGWPIWLGAAGPLLAIPFCYGIYRIWLVGLRRYQSGGG